MKTTSNNDVVEFVVLILIYLSVVFDFDVLKQFSEISMKVYGEGWSERSQESNSQVKQSDKEYYI